MGKKIDNTNTCFGVGGVLGLFVSFFFWLLNEYFHKQPPEVFYKRSCS